MYYINRISKQAQRDTGLGDYLEADILREILDSMFEGEYNAGSTDVEDLSWKASTVEFGVATWVLGAPDHTALYEKFSHKFQVLNLDRRYSSRTDGCKQANPL